MRFSKHYFNEELPDPSSVGTSSTGEHIWQQDDYLINRWVKKGILHLAKALRGGKSGEGKQPRKPVIKKTGINARDYTFREVNRSAFEYVGNTFARDYMSPDKKAPHTVNGMYNVGNIENEKDVYALSVSGKPKKPHKQMLSSDMYTTSNGGSLVLVSILNDKDEIQYFIGADDKAKEYFAFKVGKSFDTYASAKRPRVDSKGNSDRPVVDRQGKGSFSDQLIRALTGEEPETKDAEDEEPKQDEPKVQKDSGDIEDNEEEPEDVEEK